MDAGSEVTSFFLAVKKEGFMSCVRGYLDSQQKIGIIISYEGNFASMTL